MKNLVLLITVLLSSIYSEALSIRKNTNIVINSIDYSTQSKGVNNYSFYATDALTNKEYVFQIQMRDKKLFKISPKEIYTNPEISLLPIHMGEAPKDVANRIYQTIIQDLNQFNQWNDGRSRNSFEQKNKLAPILNDSKKISEDKISKNSKNETPISQEFKFNSTDSSSSYDRFQAQQTPYKVGQALAQVLDRLQDQKLIEESYNQRINQEKRQVDDHISKGIQAYEKHEGQIKASFLSGVVDYIQQKEEIEEALPQKESLVKIELTEEGKENLENNLEKLNQSKAWFQLGHSISTLSNPWSGDHGSKKISEMADSQGIMNGPIIKPNSIELSGRPIIQHRIRKAANNLQAWSKTDNTWKSSHYLLKVVDVVKTAIYVSSLLEMHGSQSDAETVLGFAEAGVDFVNGVDSGASIQVIEEDSILNVVGDDSYVEGHLSTGDFFTDLKAVLGSKKALYKTLARSNPYKQDLTPKDRVEFVEMKRDTYNSEKGPQLKQVQEKLLSVKPILPQQETAQFIGLTALRESNQSYLIGNSDNGELYFEIATTMVDIATDFVAVTSVPKDLFRLILGKDPLTGKNIESWERGFAAVGILSLGTSNILNKGIKKIIKISEKFTGTKVAAEILDSIQAPRVLSKIKNNVIVRSSEEVNEIIHVGKIPPYKPGTRVYEFTLDKPVSGEFVRVFNDPRYMASDWIVEKKLIEGMSPSQIKDILALPKTPTHIVDVEIPSQVTLRKGVSNPIFGAMGEKFIIQYEVVKKNFSNEHTYKSMFQNPREL